MARRTKREASARSPTVEIAIGAALVVGLAAALGILEVFLGHNPVALALGGAVVAELVASRAGVRWSEGLAQPSVTSAAKMVGRAIAPIAVATAMILVVARALGWAEVELGNPGVTLVFAVLRAAAVGVRDELLYRGIPFAAAEKARVPRAAAIAFASLAGAAPLVLASTATPTAIALEIGSGLAFALLWRWGPVAGIAAHAAFALFVGAAMHGALVDVTWKSGALVLGPRASGPEAVLAAIVLPLAAIGAVLILPALLAKRSTVR